MRYLKRDFERRRPRMSGNQKKREPGGQDGQPFSGFRPEASSFFMNWPCIKTGSGSRSTSRVTRTRFSGRWRLW